MAYVRMASNPSGLKTRSCPACDRADGIDRGCKNEFTLVSCQSCKSLYTSAVPDSSGTHDYDDYYSPKNLSVPDFVAKRLDEIVSGFNRYRQNNRLLDLGFGAGTLLQAASRASWDVQGVEVAKAAVEHAKNLGFNVFCGELAEVNYPTHHFDVVVAVELLEHIPNPKTMIAEVMRILRPGGLFWATTPHSNGISAKVLGLNWSAVSPPEHLQLFSHNGIITLLRDAGFQRVTVAAKGTNPFEIIHFLRKRSDISAGESELNREGFNRVDSSYKLNAFLNESYPRRMLKGMLNALLSASRLGDSLKIKAEA